MSNKRDRKKLAKRRRRARSDHILSGVGKDGATQHLGSVIRDSSLTEPVPLEPVQLAEYKCVVCGFIFSSNPGSNSCPKCKHLYLEWTNYEESWGSGSH